MTRSLHTREAEPLARRLDALRRIDDAAHAALRSALPALAERGADADALAALIDLVCQTCTEEPAGTLALIDRLEGLVPEPVSVAVLRLWAIDGLQRHRNQGARRRRHFEAGDPMAFADRDAAMAAEHWTAQRARLQHYLTGFGFADMRIELHPPQVGPHAPARVCVGDDLLMAPQRWSSAPAHASAHAPARDRLYRAAAAHAAAHLRHSPRQRPGGNRHPGHLAMASLIEDARVERLMVQQYPGLHALWSEFHVATRASAGFDFAGLTARLARALHDPTHADDNAWVAMGRQLFASAAGDLHDVAAFDHIGRQLASQMEKMRLPFRATSDRFLPGYRDDNTLLWDLHATLPEDPNEALVREHFELREPAHERPLRSVEVDMRKHSHYPEWDCKLDALRENWATVIEAAPAPRRLHAAPAARAARGHLRFSGLERIPDRSLRLKRLHDGDELDLGAAIDSVVQRAGGVTPDPRIFMRHGRRRRSTAIVLLMDLSESTGRFVPGSFTSVLEVEKRAATLVAESLDSSRDRVAVHGFSSNGRQEVHYVRIKEFDDPFGPEQKARLKNEGNRLSTRMGAALRHASEALAGESAERKLILLLTDGEPSDIDVFEDDYLVEDARHAVTSAAARGVHTFCLTLDRHADAYVRRIFGARNYLIADNAAGFAGSTGQALARLIAH